MYEKGSKYYSDEPTLSQDMESGPPISPTMSSQSTTLDVFYVNGFMSIGQSDTLLTKSLLCHCLLQNVFSFYLIFTKSKGQLHKIKQLLKVLDTVLKWNYI